MESNFNKPYFFAALFFGMLFFWLSIFGVIDVTRAWTNPAGNPPAGSGSSGLWTQNAGNIYYDSGNVGVGVPNPTAKLETTAFKMGTGAQSGYTLTSDSTGVGTWQQSASANGTINSLSKFTTANALGNSVISENTGNIGIDTVNPGAKTEIYSGTGDNILKLSRGATTSTTFRVGADSALIIQNQATDALSVKSGNVGVGTLTPGYKLDVNGTLNATDIYKAGSPLATTQWTTSGANIYYNSGNVGIGVTPGAKLDVGGNIAYRGLAKLNCSGAFTRFGNLCISGIQDRTYSSSINLIKADFGGTGGVSVDGNWIEVHICTKSEITAACASSGSNAWASAGAGRTLILGDTCGDDCSLYVGTVSACTAASQYNIDAGTNSVALSTTWSYRLCY